MSGFKGDFMGFTYNNTHSSDLGIVRVSDGSRFTEDLLPTLQDKTVQVPGGDGTYYFGSYYTTKKFNISFAFDNLTETGLAKLKRLFGDKEVHDLIFDEAPYKVWRAKVSGSATLKHMVFDEGEGRERIYKGTGSVSLTCFYPFAYCYSSNKEKYKSYKGYEGLTDDEKTARINEWWETSNIEKGGNFGDRPVPFKMDISGSGTATVGKEFIEWELPENVNGELNTKLGIVKSISDSNAKFPSGTILNQFVKGNLTAKIPVGEIDSSLRNAEFVCLYL